MYKLLLILIFFVNLTGCVTTFFPSDNEKEIVNVGGKSYQKQKDGSIILSEEEVRDLNEQNVRLLKGKLKNDVYLNDKEMELLEAEPAALFSFAGMKQGGDSVNALIQKGSLKKNLSRIIQENDWTKIVFEPVDTLIENPFVLNAESMQLAMMELVTDDEAYTCINESDKVVTVIDSNKAYAIIKATDEDSKSVEQ